MSKTSAAFSVVTGWFLRYFGWLGLTFFLTLGGAMLLMLFKDWTLKSLFTSAMAWPALAIAAMLAAIMAFFPLGRIWFFSALLGAGVYNLILLIS
ncbi:MAG: hypothetical protein KZQ58_06290 [gamma proteobacterium symbiont of Bathyaustriella thionipta]|nr:hypothetical protein [gamma proteobacterium symbiont of Bathyaustriella thionipta]